MHSADRGNQALTSRLLSWLANGDCCPASQTLVFWLACGIRKACADYPRDVPAFRRCLLAIEQIGLEDALLKDSGIDSISPEFGRLLPVWPQLIAQFVEEAGENWREAECAPKTHALLRSVAQRGVDRLRAA